jgi:hypothetical protein
MDNAIPLLISKLQDPSNDTLGAQFGPILILYCGPKTFKLSQNYKPQNVSHFKMFGILFFAFSYDYWIVFESWDTLPTNFHFHALILIMSQKSKL